MWDSETDPLENYHVHGLAVTPSNTILAFTEGRHETCDAAARELLLRRSTDGGDTWEPSTVVVPAEEGESWGNPSPVVDQQTGDVFVFFGLSLQDDGNTTCSGDRQEVYVVWKDPSGAQSAGAKQRVDAFLAYKDRLIEYLQRNMMDHTIKILLLAKFSLSFMIPTLITAGLLRIPWRRWFPTLIFADTLWTGLLVVIGYYSLESLKGVKQGIEYAMLFFSLILVVALFILGQRLKKQWDLAAANPDTSSENS